jgi:drug/metabolite transporter (DMT)-like permease
MLSLTDVAAKRALGSADAWTIAWLKFAGAAVVTAVLLTGAPWPQLWPFSGFLLLALPLEILAIYLYHRAIAQSPLSLTVPMLAFSPVFLLLVGWILLGEKPAPRGYLGVVFVTLGGYLLHLQPGAGLLGPLRAAWREPGTRLMLFVALIYAFTASLGKKLVLLSSPAFFGAFYPLTVAVTLSPLMASPRRRATLGGLPLWLTAFIAVAYGGMVFFHFSALSLAPVAYMIAVKRTSLLFAVLWGALFFHEAVGPRRLFAALLMLAGVGILATS